MSRAEWAYLVTSLELGQQRISLDEKAHIAARCVSYMHEMALYQQDAPGLSGRFPESDLFNLEDALVRAQNSNFSMIREIIVEFETKRLALLEKLIADEDQIPEARGIQYFFSKIKPGIVEAATTIPDTAPSYLDQKFFGGRDNLNT